VRASIPARFRAAARAGPSRLAVRSRTASWTYEELAAASDRVTAALLARVPDPRRPVLLFLETDAPLLAAMLGVLQAGLFYAPVDPAFEPERAAALARLADPSLIITRRGLRAAAERLIPASPAILGIDDLPAADPGPPVDIPPDAWAYVLFTSGSTGASKGIVQSHGNVLANVDRLGAGLRITPEDRITLLTSASWGASVSGIYGALLHGAAVLPFDPRAASPGTWVEWAAAEGVTIWHSVPGLFRTLARAVEDPGRLPGLRLFKLGGEAVFASDLDLFKSRFGEGAVFHVGLGMTEMNVVCQWFADHGTTCPGPVAPVGRPAQGVEAVLLDGDGHQDEGELGLVSAGLPPAYWRRPDLTARAFLPVPGDPGRRLFRTGDLVRRLPGGDLLHLGRRDRQLKVRGLRVDAGAVEAALRDLPGVREAVADLRPTAQGGRALVAWISTDEADLPALRTRLAATLPPEAVPEQIVALPELPTLGPGKIDRGRLPDPPPVRRTLDAPFVAPVSPEEAAVATVFAEVLGIETVGALDDFFALGGTSLRTLDALLGLEKALARPLDTALFLGEPTPRGIARRLSGERGLTARLTDGEGPAVFYVPGHGGGEGPDLLQLARIARRTDLPGPSYSLRLPPDLPPSAEELLESWLATVLEVQREGPWSLVATCAGGPLGLALAARLGGIDGVGDVRLVLHDALFPTRARRLRRLLRRLREPWGDDLAVRFVHHLREMGRRSFAPALRYARARLGSAARGVQRMADPGVQRRVTRQDAYLRLALARPPSPWAGPALLVVTPSRRGQGLPALWRAAAPNLAVFETGGDAEGESAAAIRRFLTR
jgi:amino acid adenylation domain-containing protein